MQESGVAVQRFYVADTASEALEAAKRLSEWRHTHTHKYICARAMLFIFVHLIEKGAVCLECII